MLDNVVFPTPPFPEMASFTVVPAFIKSFNETQNIYPSDAECKFSAFTIWTENTNPGRQASLMFKGILRHNTGLGKEVWAQNLINHGKNACPSLQQQVS